MDLSHTVKRTMLYVGQFYLENVSKDFIEMEGIFSFRMWKNDLDVSEFGH